MEGYMERCRIEYEQLCDRLDKLDPMLDGYRDGTPGFDPSCMLEALMRLADAMREYFVIQKQSGLRIRTQRRTQSGCSASSMGP